MVEHFDFMLHKPVRCVSQFINNNRRKKTVLGDLYDFPEGTMAIGRLDADTEGLLLLTTDGKFSQEVRSNAYEKEYWVQVHGQVNELALRKLKEGVTITVGSEDYLTKPAKVELHTDVDAIPPNPRKDRDPRHGPKTWIKIIISEGKNRQVRKMTAAVGHPTLRLIRWRIGNITLKGMAASEVKVLNRSLL